MQSKILLFVILLFASCTTQNSEQDSLKNTNKKPKLIEKSHLKLKSDLMTPEVLWSFGRVSGAEVSPDKKKVLYGVSYYSIPENKSNRELFVMNVDGSNVKQITHTPESEFNAIWKPDGSKIGYLSSKSGSVQLWEINPDGTNPVQISKIEGGITGFKYAPDMSKILFTKEVKVGKDIHDIYPDLYKANAMIATDLMYRHWDEWVSTYSHIFVADYDGESLKNAKDIMEGEPYHSPLKPFGGMEQINWSPDSKNIAYTSRKLTGKAYAFSTNSDIYIYDVTSGKQYNLTDGMKGYDVAPVYSPDGKKLVWQSMKRDGYEADKNRLFVYDFETKEKKDYTKDFDQNASALVWDNNNKTIYFSSDWHARFQIYSLNTENGKIKALTQGDHNCYSAIPAGDVLIVTKQSMSKPSELYAVNKATGEETQITFENKEILDQIKMGKVEKRWVPTTDGKKMLTWVIYPPNFDPAKKYPTLLYCQGGPQSSVSQFFSYRWNFQMMAANGYIVVAPNRRGLPSFGQAWNEQISGDYGGQNMKDYLSAIDALAKEPYVDKERLGAVGASYGGFSIYWLAGHHNKRFKAFIAHDGIFNLESMYLETEEMWFVDWDLGGPYWDKSNKIAQRSYANSPHRSVDKWDTPIMVIHGGKDYRIVDSQGMSAFNAAIIRGIPAKLLYFPDENHWILHPQNGILWQREFFKWLDKWLK
ncbi:MAG: S9 family peptidase [Bacteroidales bacterium]|nr:S9 family peptidase [Bacteroidales bacterium]